MSQRFLQRLAREVHVTDFLDYRSFLKALYERAKAQVQPYSYLIFASDLGFSATNQLRLVISGKRKLALRSALTIVKSLELTKEDRRYFLAMVQHLTARSTESAAVHFHDMLTAKQESITSEGDRRRMEYYSEWYHPVIRELLRIKNFQPDPTSIAQELYPPISTERIRQSLELLETLGLVERSPLNGTLRVSSESPMLLPEDATAGELSVTRYHETMIEIAKDAVSRVPYKQREMNALTLGLSQESFKLLKKKMREFCAEAMSLDDKDRDKSDFVAQLNLQLFALTKPRKK